MILSQTFLGFTLVGAEWVLYLLLGISVFSIGIIFERFWFLYSVDKGVTEFRSNVRKNVKAGNWSSVRKLAEEREFSLLKRNSCPSADTDSQMVLQLLPDSGYSNGTLVQSKFEVSALDQLASDCLLRSKVELEKKLPLLATIGSNAVFIGLFGTVLGIIKAFHDLSQSGSGAQTVMSGISEALVATAVGLMVAIPAVVAFNLFQRQVRRKLTEGEALKSFLIGSLANDQSSKKVRENTRPLPMAGKDNQWQAL